MEVDRDHNELELRLVRVGEPHAGTKEAKTWQGEGLGLSHLPTPPTLGSGWGHPSLHVFGLRRWVHQD